MCKSFWYNRAIARGKGVVLIALLACSLSATTITGTIKNPDNSSFNGYILFNLIYPGQNTSNLSVITTNTIKYSVVNGSLVQVPGRSGPVVLTGNDIIAPANTIYIARFFNNSGEYIQGLGYLITGSSFDIGSATPTPITSQYVAALDLLGLRTVSTTNLVATNATITNATITNLTTTLQCANGACDASTFTGAECGAKINNCFAAKPTCVVTNACGTTWTTAVTIPASKVLAFSQCGVYQTNQTLTMSSNSIMVGVPSGTLANQCVTLQESNGANLPALVTTTANSNDQAIMDMAFDGNQANNPTGGVDIKVNKANRTYFKSITVLNAATHGVWYLSTGTNDESCCYKFVGSIAASNRADGIFSQNTADGFLQYATEIENNSIGPIVNTNGSGVATRVSGTAWSTDSSLVGMAVLVNGILCQISAVSSTTISTTNCQSSVAGLVGVQMFIGHGIELSDSPSVRMFGDDIGGNVGDGIIMYGSGNGISSCNEIIIGNQFGNNWAHDIDVYGFGLSSAANASCKNEIVGNQMIGKNAGATANTFDDIHVVDSQFNSIANNYVQSNSAPSTRIGINITETSAGRDITESVIGNVASANFGTSGYACNTTATCSSVGFRMNLDGTTGHSISNERSNLSYVWTGVVNPSQVELLTGAYDKSITITRFRVNLAQAVLAGCAPAPIWTLSDGTNNVTCTIGNGANQCDSGAISTNFNATSVSVVTNAFAGCAAVTNAEVVATFKPAL